MSHFPFNEAGEPLMTASQYNSYSEPSDDDWDDCGYHEEDEDNE